MALSNQAPGFSPLLKNNRIEAFGERLLPKICQEIAQQSPTIHPSLSTRLPGHYEWVDKTTPKIKSRAFLAQIPKGKVRGMQRQLSLRGPKVFHQGCPTHFLTLFPSLLHLIYFLQCHQLDLLKFKSYQYSLKVLQWSHKAHMTNLKILNIKYKGFMTKFLCIFAAFTVLCTCLLKTSIANDQYLMPVC